MNTQSFSSGTGHCSPVGVVNIKDHYQGLFGTSMPPVESLEYVEDSLGQQSCILGAFYWEYASKVYGINLSEFSEYSEGHKRPRVKAILRDMRAQLTAMRHG